MNFLTRLSKKTLRLLIPLIGLVTVAAFVHGCGEDPLPPAAPPPTGTVNVTGAAV